jgi:hypothetical protein
MGKGTILGQFYVKAARNILNDTEHVSQRRPLGLCGSRSRSYAFRRPRIDTLSDSCRRGASPLSPLARHVHVTGNVEIKVAVEWGLLADTEVKSVKVLSRNSSPLSSEDKKELGRYLSEPSLTNLKTWRFHPEPRREFIAVYEYRIEGEPSEDPENPRVEFTFPVVKITATPIKPRVVAAAPVAREVHVLEPWSAQKAPVR